MTAVLDTFRKEPEGFKAMYTDPELKSESRTHAQLVEAETRLRYEHLPEHEQHRIDGILKGYHPLESLPKLKNRGVRIFISSTFTDMEQERNTLMQRTYPKLKAYCRERYGLEFQVADMRWGVQHTARDDHSTNAICMQEIRHSQLHSVGPNFVIFLGQKYGYVDIPAEIEFTTFEPIRAAIRETHEDEALIFLDSWYKKDSNAAPVQYVLQPISCVLGEDDSGWPAAERRLYDLLVEGATKCVRQGQIKKSYLAQLEASITEQEIENGATGLTRQDLRDNNVLCFIRNITNLENHVDRSKVKDFLDLTPNKNEMDYEKFLKLQDLQQRKLVPKLNKANVFKYEIRWHDPTGVDKTKHKKYLEKMSTEFYNRVASMIDTNVARQERQTKDALYEEVLQQWDIVKTRCADFMGQEDALRAISDYIMNDSDQPLIVHGQPGMGKTSLMAKAASEVNLYVQQQALSVLPSVIIRFCGTTPASSNIRQLLHSLMHQLAFVGNKFRHQLPTDFKLIKKWFKTFLTEGDFPGIVVIFLDALNQLSGSDWAHKLDWLPSKIARNVKVIVSTVPEESGILSKLKSKITNPQYSFELTPMSPSLCAEILNNSLTKHGRIINFVQWRKIREVFSQCSMPLFMKMTLEEALRWKSYTSLDDDTLASSLEACINKLFDRLEAKHGEVMVSRAMAYITASHEGISETELEDVMSLDDVLLNSVFVFWDPPVRRIPPILFPRIRNDIAGYLTDHEVDETTVTYWYHMQFVLAVQNRYLQDPEFKRDIHSNLSDYFLGTWSRMKKKPFRYTDTLASKLRIKSQDSAAVRFVPEQPLVYTLNIKETFNYRTLNQLPYHLAKAERYEDLNESIYFNYNWLRTKLKACSVQRVIHDYTLVNVRDVSLVADALRMSEAALTTDGDVLSIELSGRLLPHYNSHPNVRKLIVQCDTAAMSKCPVVPHWQLFTAPGGPLQYTIGTTSSFNSNLDCDIIQNDHTVLLTAKPFHGNCMRVWDITQGEPQPDMTVCSGSQVYPTPDGIYINLFRNNKFLQTYRVDSGELYGEVNFGHGHIRQVVVSNRYVAFTFEQGAGPVIINIESQVLVNKFQYQAKSVAVSMDNKYVVTNNGRCLILHSLPILERKCVLEMGSAPDKIKFCKDSTKFYVMDSAHELTAVTVNVAQRKAIPKGVLRDLEMKDFILSHSERHLLVRASRCLYLINTGKDTLNQRIVNMPPGVFLERLSTFKDAGFTPNDEYIIAARHIYLGVWCARTGRPIRLLQTNPSPVTKLFTSDIVSRAITLLQDQSIQVWNLDNIDADVQHLNALLRGRVAYMSASPYAKRVIACGTEHAEGRVLDLETNTCIHTLEHTEEVGKVLDDVIMSPRGTHAVTRYQNQDDPDFLTPWLTLKEDKLWDLKTGECILCLPSSRFVVFSPTDDKVVFFQCRNYSIYDWSMTAYDIVVYGLEGEYTDKSYCIGLPEGDVVGSPLITSTGQFLCAIMQLKDKSSIGSKSGRINQKSKQSLDGRIVVLVIYSFEKLWRGFKYIELQDMWTNFNDDDRFMDITTYNKDSVLLTFGRGCGFFAHTENGVIDRSRCLHKAAVQYDVGKDNIVKRYDSLLSANSRVDNLTYSSECSHIMDCAGRVFNTFDNEHENTIDIKGIAPNSWVLILDGKYVAMLSEDGRELIVRRCTDGVQKARVFIHGKALTMQPVCNDFTLAIGCDDGRVIAVSVVLNTSDPMVDVVNLLPSRMQVSAARTHPIMNGTSDTSTDISTQHHAQNGGITRRLSIVNATNNLKMDIQNIQTTQNMQKRLSTITRSEIAEQKRKNAVFKAVGHAVVLTQELKKVNNTSAACCIQ